MARNRLLKWIPGLFSFDFPHVLHMGRSFTFYTSVHHPHHLQTHWSILGSSMVPNRRHLRTAIDDVCIQNMTLRASACARWVPFSTLQEHVSHIKNGLIAGEARDSNPFLREGEEQIFEGSVLQFNKNCFLSLLKISKTSFKWSLPALVPSVDSLFHFRKITPVRGL